MRAQRLQRLHWTVIGHSYGSLVTGVALSQQGLEVDETVLVGSPGVGVTSADQLGDGNVWVGLARFDPVGYSEWFGPNPHDRGFGATRFHTGDISGHSSYFNEGSESLRNIGLITAGYLDEVNVNDGIFQAHGARTGLGRAGGRLRLRMSAGDTEELLRRAQRFWRERGREVRVVGPKGAFPAVFAAAEPGWTFSLQLFPERGEALLSGGTTCLPDPKA